MTRDIVLEQKALGFPWETLDPFLFCVFHDDAYPEGNAELGPAVPLTGRRLGNDFAGLDGWRMYHGQTVPGFPQHPHRGFETVTIVRQGFVDHSDSLGATARFGPGDAQWLTAGDGIVHCEMFPLLETARKNPLELFQIWLNLPRADKRAAAYFSMLWAGSVPVVRSRDGEGRESTVLLIAGQLGEVKAPPPPPNSWAARPESDLAIWTVKLAPGAHFTLPPAQPGSNRMLYFFRGSRLRLAGHELAVKHSVRLRPDAEVLIENGDAESELLLLQGRPIGEPVVQYGPFVMNTQAEIQQAFRDYQRTQFGGWPWPSDGPVHPRDAGRFALHPDGRRERGD
jgi:redox-sensitive bicupin YhaK (pirin superfamily)